MYRQNAGIVVFNKQRQVLLCERNDIKGAWQFPQGGIESGESVAEAALRELKEETSITTVKPVKSLSEPVRYTFTPQIIEKMQKRGITNVGQDIYWSLMYFCGNDAEINLQTPEAEFASYRWDSFANACKLAAEFKKEAYIKAYEELNK